MLKLHKYKIECNSDDLKSMRLFKKLYNFPSSDLKNSSLTFPILYFIVFRIHMFMLTLLCHEFKFIQFQFV